MASGRYRSRFCIIRFSLRRILSVVLTRASAPDYDRFVTQFSLHAYCERCGEAWLAVRDALSFG